MWCNPSKMCWNEDITQKKNFSNQEVSHQLLLSEASVKRIMKKTEVGEELVLKKKKRCGQKPIFTLKGEWCIKKICLENWFSTTKEIKFKLESNYIQASERTVRCKFTDMDFKAKRPACKLKLTEAMKKKQFQWTKAYHPYDLDFWKSISICTYNVSLHFLLIMHLFYMPKIFWWLSVSGLLLWREHLQNNDAQVSVCVMASWWKVEPRLCCLSSKTSN